MGSIKFDNTEILDTTHIPRFIKHESDPEIIVNTLDIARDDGAVIVSDRNGEKRIKLEGILTATTAAGLDTAIDTFKELFRRVGKNLDISWVSGTRRYVATCVKHEFDRDHFHLLYVPWSAEFLVPSGIGEDTSETTLVSDQTFNTQDYQKAVTFAGTSRPKPRIHVFIDSTSSTAKGVEIKNITNGERLVVTTTSGYFSVILDERLKTVQNLGANVNYYGVMPRFEIGANTLQVRVGDIVATSFETDPYATPDSEMPIYGGDVIKPAQSFILPYTDNTFRGVEVYLRKSAAGISSGVSVRIETDNNGVPSGTLAHADASATIADGVFTDGSFNWRKVNFASSFQLLANTKYWIVLRATGGDGSNYYAWQNFAGVGAAYKNGNMVNYQTSAWYQQPDNDACFRVLYGGKFDGARTYTLRVYQTKRYL